MLFVFKKIFTPLILLSFLMMAFFSFFSMTPGPDGRIRGDCPFSNMETSLCPPSSLPGAIHHISAYQSFIQVPVNSGITALIIALLITASIALAFPFLFLVYRPPAFISYSPTLFTSHDRKIKRWLSLLKHSPPRY